MKTTTLTRLLVSLVLIAGVLIWIGHQHEDHADHGECLICKFAAGWTAITMVAVLVGFRSAEGFDSLPAPVFHAQACTGTPCGLRAPPALST